MSDILTRIEAYKREEIAAAKRTHPVANLEALARAAPPPRGFVQAIRERLARGEYALIAEVKKASPSKGLIRSDFYPAELAKGYEGSGAAALSVLTDEEFFQGSLADLEAASAVVKIPCLRKDFILDPFQVLEARAAGADAILLIVAAHADDVLSDLRDEAYSIGLDVLCEVHSREELERALGLGFQLIGVNSRDLRTFVVRPELLFEMAVWMPADVTMVAESGLRTALEIAKLRAAGYDAFLVGEALMRQPDPAAALALLLDREYSTER